MLRIRPGPTAGQFYFFNSYSLSLSSSTPTQHTTNTAIWQTGPPAHSCHHVTMRGRCSRQTALLMVTGLLFLLSLEFAGATQSAASQSETSREPILNEAKDVDPITRWHLDCSCASRVGACLQNACGASYADCGGACQCAADGRSWTCRPIASCSSSIMEALCATRSGRGVQCQCRALK
ncbi:uncharacterized protein BCR38DRAFT_22397 [Pseudomassariella vexata]|uniref:Uncharacterized protein n=1 Tax=Pseudomassariella vexata TaxID=1141098 RepID=A0A1Y2EK05_9PEZI|nr:uncharacterized protein BCR38DRAFT_22397 [Pseudomassariella vexata]ORY71878.1 hypothetical protein BCR38DRAFT_22397 [Pseudomassariella vexata]